MNFAEQLVPKATLLWGATRWTVESIDDDAVIMTNASNKQLRSFPRPFIDSTAIKGNIKIVMRDGDLQTVILTKSEQDLADAYTKVGEALNEMKAPLGLTGDLDKNRKYNGQLKAREIFDELGLNHLKTPSKSELSRIATHYRKTGGDFSSCVIKTRKKQGKPLPFEIELLCGKAIKGFFLTRNKPTDTATFRYLESITPDNLKALLPSASCFRRKLKALNKELCILKRDGEAALRAYNRGIGAKIIADMLLERVEMDAMHVCLGVMDDDKHFLGYFTVYFAVDAASRAVVGYHIEVKKKLRGETAAGVMACIRNILSTQMPHGVNTLFPIGGIPDVIVMDHGTAFANARIRKLCKTLSISLQYTGTKRGWGKPIAESFVKTLRQRFLRNIKGYRNADNFKNRDSQKPEHENCVKLSELKRAAEYFIHYDYHKSKHSGLKLSTPEKEWKRLYRNPPPRKADEQDRSVFKTETKKRAMHLVRGIFLQYQYFQSPEAKDLYKELDVFGNKKESIDVHILFDPEDASEIAIIHPLTGELITVSNTDNSVHQGMSFIEARAVIDTNASLDDENDEFGALNMLSQNPKQINTHVRPHEKTAVINDYDGDFRDLLDTEVPDRGPTTDDIDFEELNDGSTGFGCEE
ncbi:DNA-binding domain-containing protein [Paraglaciecola hydrolytica]|uniref:Integrase catalytic domain-containing protein n=1 Tax=Paraglaciecola hydrolytica TaxID=1799789 RepID=A0A136A394_9ALTE|nr:DNA-binding domain-containing protein [Paraglaciecola hydrolytica]KXI29600.1 hypothetical protein AX660_05975 [Paraglaciecola hydrolytica]